MSRGRLKTEGHKYSSSEVEKRKLWGNNYLTYLLRKIAICTVLPLLVVVVGCTYLSCKTTTPPGKVTKKKQTPKTESYLSVDVNPAYGQRNQGPTQEIVLTFSETIANPSLAEALFSVEPRVSGTLQWGAPNQLKFTPSERWSYKAEVAVNLKGRREGLRGTSGHFLESDFKSYFTVVGDKTIDVNLTSQTLTLLQDEKPVFSTLISSGKPGWETPIGQFEVYAKDRVTDMASTPEAVEFYYVPDVPFVLWFSGSYSIHGTYWHNSFGRVRSHGCINVPVDAAEYVYGWTPVGTPVITHN